MFELVAIVEAAPQEIVQGTNSGRPITAYLLDNRDVHGHVQKGVGFVAVGREVTSQGIRLGKYPMIFRMRSDDSSD